MQGTPAPERLHLVTKSPRVGEGLLEAIDNGARPSSGLA